MSLVLHVPGSSSSQRLHVPGAHCDSADPAPATSRCRVDQRHRRRPRRASGATERRCRATDLRPRSSGSGWHPRGWRGRHSGWCRPGSGPTRREWGPTPSGRRGPASRCRRRPAPASPGRGWSGQVPVEAAQHGPDEGPVLGSRPHDASAERRHRATRHCDRRAASRVSGGPRPPVEPLSAPCAHAHLRMRSEPAQVGFVERVATAPADRSLRGLALDCRRCCHAPWSLRDAAVTRDQAKLAGRRPHRGATPSESAHYFLLVLSWTVCSV